MGPRAAAWDYHDGSGKRIAVVARWNKVGGKKDIRPISLNCSGWTQEGMAKPRPLYRLPDVLAANGRVYVVEGEPCVEAMRSIGLAATTSPHGADSADKADWSVLGDKAEVIINPDNDPAGEKYIAEVIAQLSKLSKLSPRPPIKILRLSGLPVGGDIKDWLDERDAIEPDVLRKTIEALADAVEIVPPGDTCPQYAEKIERVSPSPGVASQKTASVAPLWRPFPTECLPAVMSDFIKESAAAIDCDPAFIAIPALGVVAGAIGGTRRLMVKRGWSEPATAWTCVVSPSGTAKSVAWRAAVSPIFRHHRQQI